MMTDFLFLGGWPFKNSISTISLSCSWNVRSRRTSNGCAKQQEKTKLHLEKQQKNDQ